MIDMADIFAQMIFNLRDLGFFNFFLPFVLTSAIFYGLIRKSRVFGDREENLAVNGVVAVVAAMMVWGYPILAGIDIETELSRFFTHTLFVTLVFLVGILLTSFVLPPDLPKELKELLQGNVPLTLLIIGIIVALVLFVTSGFLKIILGPVVLNLPTEVLYFGGGLLILVLPLIFIFAGGGNNNNNSGGDKGKKS